jgi:hypothetical protein
MQSDNVVLCDGRVKQVANVLFSCSTPRYSLFIWLKSYVYRIICNRRLNVATFSKYKQPPFIICFASTIKFKEIRTTG